MPHYRVKLEGGAILIAPAATAEAREPTVAR